VLQQDLNEQQREVMQAILVEFFYVDLREQRIALRPDYTYLEKKEKLFFDPEKYQNLNEYSGLLYSVSPFEW